MRAVVQRVRRACVRVEGRQTAAIDAGMVILLGVMAEDDAERGARLARRLAEFRFFPDASGRMNRSILEAGGEAIVVSQVTLAADGKRGRRPSLDAAAPPGLARELYGAFVEELRRSGVPTQTGVFGASMEVELVNDGPVTFSLAL